MSRKILVTSALPYANGDIHLGHLVEYLQTDFWVRFQKMRGHECRYFCADDTHGTPIMLRANREGITPETLIARTLENHLADFGDFDIEFDHYSSTNSDANRALCEQFYAAMSENEHVAWRPVQQAYCDSCAMFLPDRFVRGSCPECKLPDQHGDSCDNGHTYSATELIDAQCANCGSTPVSRESDHLFFELEPFRDFLSKWVPEHTQAETAAKLNEWLKEELRPWDISRDDPYFGFSVPGHPGKYFYVWVDAPIGYIAATSEWCQENGRELDEFWKSDDAEIYHFIGKDIVYFHTLFWPSMLKTAGYNTPDQVFVHGFLTVNGEKMSKSKGTFINARTYLDHLPSHYLRYYYACKLGPDADDIDLKLEDFVARVNSDLIGKITNVASRGAQMLAKRIDGRIGELPPEGAELVAQAQAKGAEIAEHYERREFGRAMIAIREIAESANVYFDRQEPWKTIKVDPESTRGVLSTVLNQFRLMAIYLKPVIPSYTAQVEALFQEEPYTWASAETVLVNHELASFSHLATRIDPKAIEAIVEASRESTPEPEPEIAIEPIADTIDFGTFMNVDLRVAKIVEAEHVKGADKLLRLVLDIGSETRQVFAGIKSAYDPADLLGRHTVMVANLAARKMKFGISEGMVLAAGEGGGDLYILSPDSGAKPGQRIS
ncbi:MAG: methionyl-tRNA synthetase [Rhodothermales bacterium]|jgi:methionyl-tRNA synthetase